MSTPSHDPVAGQPFGRYVLERRLASGGMGQLFIGVMPGPGGFERRVAIKRILPHLCSSDEFVRRFIDEARIVVQLQHGNIVPVFEMGMEAGEYYIAMEYLPGWDLKVVLQRCADRCRPFPVPLALLVGIEVARGLAYAHRKTDEQGRELGIVHRDISPSNILLGRDGVVKITDFGIAKAAGKMVDSVTGMLRGKFGYMSPEQAAGLELDRRSDIFSLGVVLWEVLVGRRLFDAETDTAILRMIQTFPIPAPSTRRADVPAELDAAILRSLERDRRQRFTAAEELEQELTSLLVRLYPGTGPAELSSFLQGLFPGERPSKNGSAPLAASFDDLLRAGLEELQDIDPNGSTLTAGLRDTPGSGSARSDADQPRPAAASTGTAEAGQAGLPPGRPPDSSGSLPVATGTGSLPFPPSSQPGIWPPFPYPIPTGATDPGPARGWRRPLLLGAVLAAGLLAAGVVGSQLPSWLARPAAPPAGWLEQARVQALSEALAGAEAALPPQQPLDPEEQQLADFFRDRGSWSAPAELPQAWREELRARLAAAAPPRRAEAGGPGRPSGRTKRGEQGRLAQAGGKSQAGQGEDTRPDAATITGPTGRLTIRCDPGGTMAANGRSCGKGTFIGGDGVELPAGPHTIACTNEKLGTVSKEVTIVPGRTQHILLAFPKAGQLEDSVPGQTPGLLPEDRTP